VIAKIKPLCLFLLLSLPTFAVDIQILNGDPAGFGLNDPTVVAPIAGNMGTTLGEQRLNVIARAVDIWAQNLDSDVPVVIQAVFATQFCDATSAVLASAGTNTVNRDFANVPFASTWYHSALANAIAEVDLDPGGHDINVTINIALDADPNCLGGNGWYYGFDHNQGNQSDLLAVLLHEFAHGLGFANFVNETVGSLFNGLPDIYTTFTRDLETDKDWNDMTNAERVASAINDPDVVWTGDNVTAAVPNFLNPLPQLTVNSPGTISGVYDAQGAAFGPPIPNGGITGNVVLVDDGSTGSGTGTINDGCETLINAGAVSGNIALIDRGDCTFVQKVLNAQAAGAVAVLIANNTPDGLPPMGGDDPTVTIPSIGISQATGNLIKGELPGVNVTIGLHPTEFAGTNQGFLRLYAPDPVEPGSTISHWSVDAEPSLLMEPAITPDLTDDVDLTLEHFTDIGWTLFPDCIEGLFVTQPEDQTLCEGDDVTFTVSASGTDVTYQWKKDGNVLGGEVNPTLELTGITAADEGLYTCEIDNNCMDPLPSNGAQLNVVVLDFDLLVAEWRTESTLDCEDTNANGFIDVADLVDLLP